MSIVSRCDLDTLLESHIYKDLQKKSYKLKKVKSSELLTCNRLDIAFKLLYLETKGLGVGFAEAVYREHIRALTLGEFSEPGNKEKDNIEKFIEEFDNISSSIENGGFDREKSLVPLSENGSIVNGAHRVASAIFYNKDVDCIETESQDHIYDYKFFYNRNISNEMLDAVSVKFIEYADDVYIAFLWPIKSSLDISVDEFIPNIVYKKRVQLSPNGAHNLLSQIYYGEKWLGSMEDDFKGSQGKIVECFKNFDFFDVVAFQASSLNKTLKIKDNIRRVFNVGKHSIHITDSKSEAVRVARIVFNNNSLHFLNHAKPNRYPLIYDEIKSFKKFVRGNGMVLENTSICGDFVLSIYGLLNCPNIDCFIDRGERGDNQELKYYKTSRENLVFNPVNYFYFENVKFISFDLLYKVKKRRAKNTDLTHCRAMKLMIDSYSFNVIADKIRQRLLYGKIRARKALVKYVDMIGLGERIRAFLRKGGK